MKTLKASVLVGLGMVAGCSAAVSIPATFAAPEIGTWGCYHSRNIGNADFGEEAGKRFAELMNRVGATAVSGTVLSIPTDKYAVVCIKN